MCMDGKDVTLAGLVAAECPDDYLRPSIQAEALPRLDPRGGLF